ncbi:hypothetical protein PG994_002709 [Apiospora phragmitis]|uniref:Uncharacterized protein n=1 Tax=Apiospora phragmitis TaxID=2905665 RepID=A0ABR1W5X4_9PEZI
MKSFTFATLALAAVARAQLPDLEDLAESVPAPISVTPPFGGNAEELTSTLRFAKRATCAAQAEGKGPAPEVDTPAGFLADADFAATALNADAPAGYFDTFQNAKGSIEGVGYKTFKTIDSYSTAACAGACTAMDGCNAFNIFYERNGLAATGDDCPKPKSTTIIKCSFWTVPVVADHATNIGNHANDQPDNNQFGIVIAASNGYVSNKFKPVAGWHGTTDPVDAAINAPNKPTDTFIRSQTFPISADYKGSNCAKACADQAAYEYRHPSAGGARACQFVNSYLLLKNGVAQSQVCSMPWDNSYATNSVQKSGGNNYSITFGLSYSNGTVATQSA